MLVSKNYRIPNKKIERSCLRKRFNKIVIYLVKKNIFLSFMDYDQMNKITKYSNVL